MQFDARAAKALQPGEHLTIGGHPGLRLSATGSTRTWSYRYKSPVDARMRQVKIGRWPAISEAAAIVAWEALRAQRDGGEDPALAAREKRSEAAVTREKKRAFREGEVRTVRQVCDYYLAGHIDINRAPKGGAEVHRTFDTMLGQTGALDATDVTRSVAFDLIQSFSDRPVQASILRRELGAAWDFALDAGKLAPDTPNWWRLILRGKLRSKGKVRKGKRLGTNKRVLSPDEAGELIRWMPNFTRLISDILTLYLWTGVRGAEIVSVEGAEIGKESIGIWWTIPKHKTKNKRIPDATDHRVPLYGRAQEILLRRKELYGDGYLFPCDGVHGHSEQKVAGVAVWYHHPDCELRPMEKRARLTVTNWAPHDLRRTARTFLAALKCPRDVGEVITGHVLKGVEGTYNRHTYDKERQVWLKRLDQYLEKLAKRR